MGNPLARLTDEELFVSLRILVVTERRRTVDILKHLAELDLRRAAEKRGFPSLFEYCVRDLRYPHGAAARLIHTTRAAAKFPVLYRVVERGLLSVSTVSILAPHLKWNNHRKLIREASGRSARDIEALVARLTPGPPRVERIRFVGAAPASAAPPPAHDMFSRGPEERPEPSPAAAESLVDAAPPADSTAPADSTPPPPASAPARVEFTFYADARVWLDFQRLKELTRSRWPSGRVEEVIGGALEFMLERVDPERRKPARAAGEAAAGAPGNSRRIPSSVSAIVWRRDKGRCVYRAETGRECGARAGLEIDHIVPWALGGRSDKPGNLRLLCRSHNQLEARRLFGDAKIDAAIRGP
ncbi:MAG: HNH endonuclease [Elusimicrobiota bacterium]|nr:MAG: HNH endonuclease [Elusimicrobiota bacterium]